MKQIYLKPILPFVVIISILIVTACTEKLDEHYDVDSFNLPDKTLNEIIQEYSDLSIFSQMLKKTGYDKILDASQTYTVWAPVNDALSNIDTTDLRLVQEIIENHITRSRFTTSGVYDQSVRMLNGKYVSFSRDGSGFKFGGNLIIDANLPAINGLIHVIDGYTPYMNNLWEYIGRTTGLDSLRSYLYSQSQNLFDPENSTEIGIDSNGAGIYDSVFIYTNLVLKKIGAIDTEDSIYTAIMPNNTAWNEAYERIGKYYNIPDSFGGPQRKRELTRFTIVKDMLFLGQVTQPEVLDLLVSTTGSVFYDPGNLFNTEPVTLSNGLAYVTSKMPYADTSSWFKKIKVEAEETEGRDNASSNIYLRTSYGSGLDVSKNKYILVEPSSTISKPSVEFSIPNTLSAKYNIYCVFVPASILDPLNLNPTKAKFMLTYIRRKSGSVFHKEFIPENSITNSVGMTKMFVTQFDFEYANIIDEEYDQVLVKLEVINDVEEEGTFTRTMRIDCIIFEPVLE
ncbi:MAG: fasciclin domain-containing protein [Bacteroidales bacterium]|nr:fasciclin domain-containing protein [Bacteroidales bacterium]